MSPRYQNYDFSSSGCNSPQLCRKKKTIPFEYPELELKNSLIKILAVLAQTQEE
ncbi:Hypothetical protein HVR_LOCUS536 [uncultured virus]|nr:Hypothetical protein HVR_LOCUS536 [uncultured virus]